MKVDDSKKLSLNKREELYVRIVNQALLVVVGMVSVDKINEIDIATANRLAMKTAADNLTINPDFMLIDCIKIDNLRFPKRIVPQGGSPIFCIATASIISKVTRDRLMNKVSRDYPKYG